MERRWLWLLLILFSIDGVLFFWWLHRKKEGRFDAVIRQAADRYHIDPALVKAVIWRESAFQPLARGASGEIGLMQIRSLAAQEWAEAEGLRHFGHEHLRDVKSNIFAGTWYLAKLSKRYLQTDRPMAYALADYNAGRSNVLRWMHGSAKTNSGDFLSAMDFPGTRRYIDHVLQRYTNYGPNLRLRQP